MRRVVRSFLAATAGLLLAAGLAASPAEAAARPTSDPSHVHSTQTSMPGMDHKVSPMPGMDHGTGTPVPGMDHEVSPMPGMDHEVSPMPGMDHEISPMPGMDHEVSPMPGMDHGTETPMPGMGHDSGSESRPRALLLGGFGGLNGVVLITAFMLRRRTKARHR